MPRAPAAPFEQLEYYGESITLDTTGEILVIPTGNADILPSFNEYTLNSNRLTIAESPFGGLKGSQSPDYAPGTLFCQTEGVVIQDTSGLNPTQTMTTGKLKELSLLTVDTSVHTIEEQFIIANPSTSNSPTVINDGSDATGWAISTGSLTSLVSENGRLKIVGRGTSSSGLKIYKSNVSLTGAKFLTLKIECDTTKNLYVNITEASNTLEWRGARFPIPQNTVKIFVLPLLAPQGTSGMLPSLKTGTINFSNTVTIRIGTDQTDASDITLYLDDIQADVSKSAYLELSCNDFLSDTSAQIYTHDGTTYQLCRTCKLDTTYADVSTTDANCTFADGTKISDVYGSTGAGRSVFPKGLSGETKTGSLANSSMTYSANKGTSRRVGIRVDLPPSDGGRTAFNSVRFKTVLYYDDINHAFSRIPDSSGMNNTGTIYGCNLAANKLAQPYSAIQFDGIGNYIDFGSNSSLTTQGARTVSFWMKSTQLSGNKQIISFSGQRGISFVGNRPILYLNTDNYIYGASNNSYFDGAWKHVVVTFPGVSQFDIDSTCFFVNGSQISNTPRAQGNSPAAWGVHKIGSGTYGYFSGTLADIRIYNRVLSSDEITALYNNQSVSSTGLVASWNPSPVKNMGSTSYEFSDSTSASYGLQNLVKPWIALYDPTASEIDFFLFTYRPKALVSKRDETGNIHELQLYPGNGQVYWGRIKHCNLTLDSNSNLIPDCLESSIVGSLTKFLEAYEVNSLLITTSEGDLLTTSEGHTLEVE